MDRTAVTWDVWTGDAGPPADESPDHPHAPHDTHREIRRHPSSVSTAVAAAVLGAAVLGAAVTFIVLLAVPGLHPAVAPAVGPAPGEVAVLEPEQLEKLTVLTGDDEWVLIRRPHQGP